MRRGQCSQCTTDGPLGEMLSLDGALLCRGCAETRAKDAAAAGNKLRFQRVLDLTICARCQADNATTDFPQIAGIPMCGNCAVQVYERPFPIWLKAGMAALLVLLAVALIRGGPYFSAGRHLVLGRRALDRQDYATASRQLAEVLKVGPTDQEVILLGAEADLQVGDVAGAQAFLTRRTEFDRDELYSTVNTLWGQAVEALQKAQDARTADSLGHEVDAARLMHEASRTYPQSPALAVSAMALDINVAFDRKDYDAAVDLSKAARAKMPDSPFLAAYVASALASKYAVTGDSAFRSQAEQMLATAESLSRHSSEDSVAYVEYAERIRYRLATRVIIDKAEYDRRFRPKGGAH